ncbi:hypothetical protein SLEP1_g51431 [Rubroshorea leprosula]|uniref:Uncharacterized protein n=1 Tax=Rubroshorea leprosula TaxID=152421 RepID=A0AAV5M401_9ROSI|nr:hypothetical protein SLEP1_g51431 [Rubroshorea leprosula]
MVVVIVVTTAICNSVTVTNLQYLPISVRHKSLLGTHCRQIKDQKMEAGICDENRRGERDSIAGEEIDKEKGIEGNWEIEMESVNVGFCGQGTTAYHLHWTPPL